MAQTVTITTGADGTVTLVTPVAPTDLFGRGSDGEWLVFGLTGGIFAGMCIISLPQEVRGGSYDSRRP